MTEVIDLFILAMCHGRLGATDQANDCFDRAVKECEAEKDILPHPARQFTGRSRCHDPIARALGGKRAGKASGRKWFTHCRPHALREAAPSRGA